MPGRAANDEGSDGFNRLGSELLSTLDASCGDWLAAAQLLEGLAHRYKLWMFCE
jgi:hypothetical protein